MSSVLTFPVLELQPSQFYLSLAKVQGVQSWFDPEKLTNFEPISIKQLDNQWVVVDGHSRLFVAYQMGLKTIPVQLEQEDWNWDFYRFCIQATKEKNIQSIADLATEILSQTDYETLWIDWCQQIYNHYFSKGNH
ncbi:hypothetical protein IAG15_13965 [Enterococcus faecalis]|nr:hypothetical protein [Enterococcus faecalis]